MTFKLCQIFRNISDWYKCLIFRKNRIKKTLRLLLTSDDGYLYIYGLDVHEGGDCHLIRQFLLTNASSTGLTEADLAREVLL